MELGREAKISSNMRGGRFSLILIGLCIVAALAAPPLREAGRDILASQGLASGTILAGEGEDSEVFVRLEKAATREGLRQDPVAQLAFFMVRRAATGLVGSAPSAEAAGQAAELAQRFPESAPVRLWAGLEFLARAQEERQPATAGVEKTRSILPMEPLAADNPRLVEARSHLRAAAESDAENAAPTYLLAYSYLIADQLMAAKTALQAAMAQPLFSTYDSQLAAALVSLHEEGGIPRMHLSLSVLQILAEKDFAKGPLFRALARELQMRARDARQAGDHETALFYYAAGLHLGKAAFEGSFSMMDGHYAAATLGMMPADFLSEAEKASLKKEGLSRAQELGEMQAIREENFRVYLRERGREDLAELHQEYSHQMEIFRHAARRVIETIMPRITEALGSPFMVLAMTSWGLLSFVFVLFLLVILFSLIARYWKDPKAAPVWRWWQWAVLFVVSVAPPLVCVPLFARLQQATSASACWDSFAEATLITGISLGFPALLVLVPVIAGLWKRRRLPADARMGKFRAVLASWRILLPPTIAVLLAVALLFSALAQMRLAAWAAQEKEILLQGEVQYWKIGQIK